MNRAKQIVLAILLMVVVVTAAFLFLDFRLAQNDISVEQTMSTYGMGEGTPEGMYNSTLEFTVTGADTLARALEASLQEALAAEPAFPTVRAVQELPEEAPNRVLVVDIEERDLFWTPVYGSGRVEVAVAYASNGDLSWRGESPVHMSSEEGSVTWSEGTFTFEGSSLGILSRPAYHRLIAEELASAIAGSLENVVAGR